QQIAHALGEVGQLHRASRVVSGGVQRNQRSQPAAIDVSDAAQIQHNLAVLANQFLEGIAEQCRFFAEHDPAAAIDDGHTLRNPRVKFQLHGTSMVWPEPTQPKSLSLGRILRKGPFSRWSIGLDNASPAALGVTSGEVKSFAAKVAKRT